MPIIKYISMCNFLIYSSVVMLQLVQLTCRCSEEDAFADMTKQGS
jgi:hypothetical protein